MARDDFSARTKNTLAIRAAHFCSSPYCLKLTAGPHSDPGKGLTTGHAAHIKAASPLGPRYDKNQTPDQRKHISNGLWLCRECGDIVDKDDALYSPEELTRWKTNHEAMISEVRTKGYSESLALLQSRRTEPTQAKRIVAILEDRRVLWASFDAEFPERVRQSLDHLRTLFVEIRSTLPDASPLDQILLSLTKTIHGFFDAVGSSDLMTLRCNSSDPEWCRFRDSLAALRKAVGYQISNLANVYGVKLSEDLSRITPTA